MHLRIGLAHQKCVLTRPQQNVQERLMRSCLEVRAHTFVSSGGERELNYFSTFECQTWTAVHTTDVRQRSTIGTDVKANNETTMPERRTWSENARLRSSCWDREDARMSASCTAQTTSRQAQLCITSWLPMKTRPHPRRCMRA